MSAGRLQPRWVCGAHYPSLAPLQHWLRLSCNTLLPPTSLAPNPPPPPSTALPESASLGPRARLPADPRPLSGHPSQGPFLSAIRASFPKRGAAEDKQYPSFCRGKGALSSQCSRESVDSTAPSGEQPSSEDSCIMKPASPALSQDFPGSVATETSVPVTSINSPQAWCVTDPTLGRAR